MNSGINFRILILAPAGADARNAQRILEEASCEAKTCATVDELCKDLRSGCAGVVLTEEAITPLNHRMLSDLLDDQPAWSDVPILLITSGGQRTDASDRAVAFLGVRSNVTLIERPLRISTLVASVKTALKARIRQYEVRDLIEERETLLTSLEARVSDRTAKLQETVNELEAFSYSVSHDLRTPLRALQGYAEVLQAEYGPRLDKEAETYLQRIQKAATRMDQLTRDLLMYSRVARGELKLEPIDLDPLIQDVVDQYPAVNAARAHIQIRTPLGVVLGHAPSLVQCFSNLIENAIKFVAVGDEPEVKIFSEKAVGRIRINIKDNGIGIDPAHHPRIFEIFERVSDKGAPGTGIGLAIVKKAVGRMGGSVHLTSAPHQGSTFTIDLTEAVRNSS